MIQISTLTKVNFGNKIAQKSPKMCKIKMNIFCYLLTVLPECTLVLVRHSCFFVLFLCTRNAPASTKSSNRSMDIIPTNTIRIIIVGFIDLDSLFVFPMISMLLVACGFISDDEIECTCNMGRFVDVLSTVSTLVDDNIGNCDVLVLNASDLVEVCTSTELDRVGIMMEEVSGTTHSSIRTPPLTGWPL